MSLKGTVMTDKVLRGKINNIRQIEDVNALHAEAERLIASASEVIEAEQVLTAAEEATAGANTAKDAANTAANNAMTQANAAETAARNANAVIMPAVTETERANKAATAANEAEGKATTAADEAISAADSAYIGAEEATNAAANAREAADKAKAKIISSASVNSSGNLVVTLQDQTSINAGSVIGPKGDKGDRGERGQQGVQGVQGVRGEKGDKGDSADDLSILANALKGSTNGNPIVLTDVSPFEHEVKANLSYKNLFYFAETLSDSGEANEEDLPEDWEYETTWSYEAKKGTSEIYLDNAVGEFLPYLEIVIDLGYLLNQLDPNKQYTISVGTKTDMFGYIDFNGSDIWIEGESTPLTFYPKGITEPILHIYDGGSTGTFGIQIEEGTTATAYAPYADVNGATVTKYGKNLFQYDPTDNEGSNAKVLEHGENSIILQGLAGGTPGTNVWSNGWYYIAKSGAKVFKGVTHIFSCDLTILDDPYRPTDIKENVGIAITPGAASSGAANSGKFFTRPSVGKKVKLYQTFTPTCDSVFFLVKTCSATIKLENFQLEVGNAYTEYEPYKEPITYTADENGNVEGIIGNGEGMTLFADEGISISAEYNKDLNKVVNDIYQKLSALGVAVVNN